MGNSNLPCRNRVKSYKLVDEKDKLIVYDNKELYFRTKFGAIEFQKFLERKYPWRHYKITPLFPKEEKPLNIDLV